MFFILFLFSTFSTFSTAALAAGEAAAGEAAAGDSEALKSESCLECHNDKDIEPETDRGKGLELFVKPDALEGSVHEELGCADCHGGAETFEEAPHNGGRPLKLLCANCHDEENRQYNKSIHGLSYANGDDLAATCKDCHGGHQIHPSTDPKSSTYKFTLYKTCGKCHQSGAMLDTHSIGDKEAVTHYVDSIHGRALLVDGLVVAPSCNDCHGVHDILPSEHPNSKVHKDKVPKTCGKCHVLVEEVYNKSIHGKIVSSHDQRGPSCITCHSSHEISNPAGQEFRIDSDRKCGSCHADRLKRYQESFHGKAMALGRAEVATCYDCHGHHDIVKSSNPLSHISKERRLGTCRKCHPKAPPNFADYIVHADHTDKKNYPFLYYAFWFMTSLLLGTFAFFALNSGLWLSRSLALYFRDSKSFREHKAKEREDIEEYIRFKPVERFLHGLVISSFLLLVITGMPLKFFHTAWAKWLLSMMGGQAVAAVLHRLGAIITIFYFSVHVIVVLYGFFSHRDHFKDPETGKYSPRRALGVIFGPDSPMPNRQDLRDFVAHQKWFFGRGEKPQFDRWTYWEKFDYMAVFWGVAVIGFSGLIMWFPEFFTHFLPGWSINIALIVHSDEALLAAGFIFTFHFFNVHFRPEKFPMDPVIFSGKISKTELLNERRRLYDRWKASGELEKHVARDQWEAWKKITLPAGFMAFLSGVGLLILILYAMVTRLLGG